MGEQPRALLAQRDGARELDGVELEVLTVAAFGERAPGRAGAHNLVKIGRLAT